MYTNEIGKKNPWKIFCKLFSSNKLLIDKKEKKTHKILCMKNCISREFNLEWKCKIVLHFEKINIFFTKFYKKWEKSKKKKFFIRRMYTDYNRCNHEWKQKPMDNWLKLVKIIVINVNFSAERKLKQTNYMPTKLWHLR